MMSLLPVVDLKINISRHTVYYLSSEFHCHNCTGYSISKVMKELEYTPHPSPLGPEEKKKPGLDRVKIKSFCCCAIIIVMYLQMSKFGFDVPSLV